ncbi:MAG: hypothetical protein HYX44_07450, partial [Aquabacterium sp.]|nr:hypothetical protein [Aquabacterium sp.]
EQLGLPQADQQFDEGQGLKKPDLDKVLDRLVASVVRQAHWRVADTA